MFMQKLGVFSFLALSSSLCVSQQVTDKAITPKPSAATPPVSGAVAEAPKAPAPEASDEVIVPQLKGIILVGSAKEIQSGGAKFKSELEVFGPAFLKNANVKDVVAAHLGRPLTEKSLAKLQEAIIQLCRAQKRPIVDVYFPEQEIPDGVVQMAVIEGRVGEIKIDNPGRKWFSDRLIKQNIRFKNGDPIDHAKLLEDVNWLNRNPFRQVEPQMMQGKFDPNKGTTDVVLKVQDRLPLRGYVGYENTGNTTIGEDRFLIGTTWGNALWLDHRLNYQFAIDESFRKYKAHSGSYAIPLPWHHEFTVFASYADVAPELAAVGGLKSRGEFVQISGKYTVSLPKIQPLLGGLEHELAVGFDFKRTAQNFTFGGTTFSTTPVEVDQLVGSYRAYAPDRFGSTTITLEGYYSPGRITDKNSDNAFDNNQSGGAKAVYYYIRLSGERIIKLPADFSISVLGGAQFTDDRLLPSEELGLGGVATIRGYDERVVNRDKGWYVRNELRTPSMKLGNMTGVAGQVDTLQLYGFFDYGVGRANIFTPVTPSDAATRTMASFGGGLRYAMARNLAANVDFGYQLREKSLTLQPNTSGRNWRSHISVSLGF
jgi:hemolysin activation/secretion protein